MFCLVLHSHLPWLAHHGRWPVGEEWLYQSWASCYIPLVNTLHRLADRGHLNNLSLGITPIVAAQLDDPYCLEGMHHWLGNWAMRAWEATSITESGDQPGQAYTPAAIRECGNREYRAASAAIEDFEKHWRTGGSAVFRRLFDDSAAELLGGPLAHPFQPVMDPKLREFALREGLKDSTHRFGQTPQGIWAPECAFTPGMEQLYERAGVRYFLVDGPSLDNDTALARPVRDSSTLCYARDMEVSYRVWSPTSGYPGHPFYRDFYAYDHQTGFKPGRVTDGSSSSDHKAAYDPTRADATVDMHVGDFVETVIDRLRSESARIGRDALVVCAFDTELFGHWWYEGPQWLERVIPALREAGVNVGTLQQATEQQFIGDSVQLENCSWGTGKDWRVWTGPQVQHFVELNDDVTNQALSVITQRLSTPMKASTRDAISDQIAQETLLTLQSDWPFMVSKDTAATYATDRAYKHAHATREICDNSAPCDDERAHALVSAWRHADNPFPDLDARFI